MPAPKYVALFLAESREHLAACNQLLLVWERNPVVVEPVGGLFRAVHNLKGMAATMGYDRVAALAHAVEHLLDAVRGARVTPSERLIELLFRAVDTLERGVEAAAAGREVADEAALLEALEREAAGPRGGSGVAAEPHGGETAAWHGGGAEQSGAAAPLNVSVTIRSGAAMRGARAVLALKRVEALGQVSALRPPLAALERDDFDGRFTFRLRTHADPAAVEVALRSAGEVESVSFVEPAAAEAEGEGTVRDQIRIDRARLDAMMKRVGELAVARNRLLELVRGDGELAALAERISRLTADLQAEVLAARMTPVGEAFERFPRLVRDLGRELGKRIRLEIEGAAIELDRAIVDALVDPLLHLIRNAADHGLETPAERERAGKPPEGVVKLTAVREHRTVAIHVSDDGRGIDREAVLAKARREGLPEAVVEPVSDDLLLRLLARPGFSTARQVSGVSGRGVGVEVAYTRARQLGGSLELHTEPGRGTTFTLRLPPTLAIVRALLAEVGGERYAVPLSFVAETVEFDPGAVTAIRDREALLVRERVIPTVHLDALVSAPRTAAAPRRPTVILEVGDRRTALVVDALVGQQDIVIEPFDAPRGVPAYVGGATILADGAPALILDAAALV